MIISDKICYMCYTICVIIMTENEINHLFFGHGKISFQGKGGAAQPRLFLYK